jgi:phosphatidylserine synthase
VALDPAAIYLAPALIAAAESGRPPAALCRVTSAAEAAAARRLLAAAARKTIDQDGVVSYFAFRPLSRQMTRLVLDTRVTPNHVSLAAMAFGVAAAVLAGFGGRGPVVAAGLLYWIGAVVDCVDGEIARFRIEGSKTGEWLDTLADDVSTYGLLAGLSIGLVGDGYPPAWNLVGVGGAAIGFAVQAKLYADLHRWGMTIDTAQYPWFFGAPSSAGQGERGVFGWIFYGVAFLFRRDAFVTGIAILLVAGFRRLAIAVLGLGVAVILVLFLVHVAVTALAREPGR